MHVDVTVVCVCVLCEDAAVSLRCVSEPSKGKAVLIFLSAHYLSFFAFFKGFFVEEEEKGEAVFSIL